MQTNKALRWAILAGVFALPFIFFWNPSDFFFPFITGKNFAFRIIVEIVAALAAILAVRDSEHRPRRSLVFYAYLAFVAILAVADVLGPNLSRSFWSNYERMDGFVTQLHLLLYFFALIVAIDSKELWEAFLKTNIGASVLMCFYGLFQLLGLARITQSATRVDGGFGNATYLAVYLLFHIFFALYLIVKHKGESLYRWVLGLVIIFQLLILYYTATRGDILGLGLGVLVAAGILAFTGEKGSLIRKASLGVITAAVVVVLGFLAIKNTDFVQTSPVLSRFASISASDGTTESRLMIWGMAYQGWKERPILGWGQENFNLVFSKYYNPGMYGQEPWFDRAHNVFFDWLVAGGTLGLLAYLALFGCALWALFKNPRFDPLERATLTGLFVAYFFQNLFVFDNLGSYFLFVTLIAYVSWRPKLAQARGTHAPQPGFLEKNEWAVEALSIVFVIAAGAAVYFLNVPAIEANTALIQAYVTHDQAYFKTALSYGTFGNPEIREQILEAAVGSLSNADYTNDQRLQFINFAIDEMKQQVLDTPLDSRPKLLFGGLLRQVGLTDEAILVLKAAQEQSPKKQAILFELASAYLAKKDYANAIMAAKQAYDLAPQYDEAGIILALIDIYDGKFSDADVIVKAHPNIVATDDRILNAYVTKGQYAPVEAIWQQRIAKDPNNPDLYVTFGGMLSDLGHKSEAVAEIRKGIALESAATTTDAVKKQAYIKAAQDLISQIERGM